MDTFERGQIQIWMGPFASVAWQELLLWYNWPKTAIIFILILMLLMDMASNPILSVLSVAGAVAISVSFGYITVVWAIRKLNKSNEVEHPLKRYLEMDITISNEMAQQVADLIIVKLNPILLRLRSLFLIEDMLDSLKLLLIFCGINMIGDYVNGITLLALAVVLLFTLPKIYELNQMAINEQLKQLQLLKTQLMGPRDKMNMIPTATVDPQFIGSDLTQKGNFVENNENNVIESFPSFEDEIMPENALDYNWPEEDISIEELPDTK